MQIFKTLKKNAKRVLNFVIVHIYGTCYIQMCYIHNILQRFVTMLTGTQKCSLDRRFPYTCVRTKQVLLYNDFIKKCFIQQYCKTFSLQDTNFFLKKMKIDQSIKFQISITRIVIPKHITKDFL